jgi:hypothetical protein
MPDFSGRWQTTFGTMDLSRRGRRISGTYHFLGGPCGIDGEVHGNRLTFTYREPTVQGEGWFELKRQGRAFAGQYRPHGGRWESWIGERIGFDGLWNSTFGLLRLVEDEGRVRGWYTLEGGSTLRGRLRGRRCSISYREPEARGRARFELADDGLSFHGEWRPTGDTTWRPWTGVRVRPQPGLVWLVVLEAPWQRSLAEREYSFGSMLREFFARVAGVQVRHRFFTNDAALRRSCRELLFLAEPIALVVATHARPEGLSVGGQIIGIRPMLDVLRDTGDLRLVHFSACLLLSGADGLDLMRAFANDTRAAISGYTTSVDWAASAVIEFTYLDLVLSRGLAPAVAAKQLRRLLPFAGDTAIDDTDYPPAGFRIITPDH